MVICGDIGGAGWRTSDCMRQATGRSNIVDKGGCKSRQNHEKRINQRQHASCVNPRRFGQSDEHVGRFRFTEESTVLEPEYEIRIVNKLWPSTPKSPERPASAGRSARVLNKDAKAGEAARGG